jgi:hypothetical protein
LQEHQSHDASDQILDLTLNNPITDLRQSSKEMWWQVVATVVSGCKAHLTSSKIS